MKVRQTKAILKVIPILLVLVFSISVNLLAQTNNQAKPTEQKGNDEMTKMLDYSRPGEHHAALSQLSGTWNFQDTKLHFVKGTLTRKPIYDGRFYQVTITGGKLKVPVAGGQMKEESYQSMQIEGYDNPKMKFVTTSINNHIGSDIQLQSGTYDAVKNEFTYYWDDELIPGEPKKNKRVLKIEDAIHYIEAYYEIRDDKEIKIRELDYTKTGD